MITEFQDPAFISSLPRMPIAQLPITQSAQDVPASPAVWFAVDETNTVWYVGEAKNLRYSLSSRHPKIKAFRENGVSSIAYLVVEKKQRSLAKEAREEFNPPLNQNKSDIFVPAINLLVKKTDLPRREIIIKSDIGENYLNDLENNNRGIYASHLEKILLSDCVTKDIFK
jgi:excinuclease UvrABC nuclease subunit